MSFAGLVHLRSLEIKDTDLIVNGVLQRLAPAMIHLDVGIPLSSKVCLVCYTLQPCELGTSFARITHFCRILKVTLLITFTTLLYTNEFSGADAPDQDYAGDRQCFYIEIACHKTYHNVVPSLHSGITCLMCYSCQCVGLLDHYITLHHITLHYTTAKIEAYCVRAWDIWLPRLACCNWQSKIFKPGQVKIWSDCSARDMSYICAKDGDGIVMMLNHFCFTGTWCATTHICQTFWEGLQAKYDFSSTRCKQTAKPETRRTFCTETKLSLTASFDASHMGW